MRVRLAAAIYGVLLAGSSYAQTGWSAPSTIPGVGPTSVTAVSAPVLAPGLNGGVTAAWLGKWGTNRTVGSTVINSARHSQVFVASSTNRGLQWTSRQQLSDPRNFHTFPNAIRTAGGETHLMWQSGDILSGFRLHTAASSDGGVSFTSSTRLQNLNDTSQGYVEPQIVSTASSLVMGWNGFKQGAVMTPVINVSADSGMTWNNIATPDVPSTATEGVISFHPAMAVSAATIMVPLTLTYQSAPVWPYVTRYENIVMISRDAGLTWETRFDVTPAGINAGDAQMAYDGNGKWFMFWSGYTQADYSDLALYVQTSTDDGVTWSAPVVIPGSNESVISAATDSLGRWIALLRSYSPGSPLQYLWSENNGGTWSTVQSITGSKAALEGNQVVFLGDGMWATTWADGVQPRISKMTWGPSAVNEWELY